MNQVNVDLPRLRSIELGNWALWGKTDKYTNLTMKSIIIDMNRLV